MGKIRYFNKILLFFYSINEKKICFLCSNLCHCGNDLNQPSVNSAACNIPCDRSSHNMIIDCCGGQHLLTIYNVNNYR